MTSAQLRWYFYLQIGTWWALGIGATILNPVQILGIDEALVLVLIDLS
jgi:hypothetical protein